MELHAPRSWLEREDEVARPEREARLEWIVAHYPAAEGFLLSGGWLSQEDFDRFDRMRRLRNPLVHFRRPLAADAIEARAVGQNSHPDAVLEKDAREILEGVLRLLGRSAV
ncbi:MAG: hypothetical protein MUQ00_04475 [Candidatus Aminicenantes bacterium]|nr:hypothetical protein [Candidatus Aminicenantes bacterium]